jgi:CRISPR/Cas system-associated exonuclease Cas4 (RecB family)
MKKIILTLVITASSFASDADTSIVKPMTINGTENVSKKVLDAFKTDFTAVKDAEWITGSGYYRASFIFNEKHVFAFYDMDGGLLGVSRYISPVDLPLNLQISLKKNYNEYWISDLFEVSKNETTSYYITLENAETKTILKSTGSSEWEEYKTVKKL